MIGNILTKEYVGYIFFMCHNQEEGTWDEVVQKTQTIV